MKKNRMFLILGLAVAGNAFATESYKTLSCQNGGGKVELKLPAPPTRITYGSSFEATKPSGEGTASSSELICSGNPAEIEINGVAFQRTYDCIEEGTLPYFHAQVVEDQNGDSSVFITEHFHPAKPPKDIVLISGCKFEQ